MSKPIKTAEVTMVVAIIEMCASAFAKKWCVMMRSGNKTTKQISA